MRRTMRQLSLLAVTLFAAFACTSANGSSPEVDPATLYEISTEGTTTKVKAGEQGKVVFTIKTKNTGHISDAPPFRLKFESQGVQLAKTAAKLNESTGPKPKYVEAEKASHYFDARFEVPFTATAPGEQTIDAKLKFAICADEPKKVCIMLPPQTHPVKVAVQ